MSTKTQTTEYRVFKDGNMWCAVDSEFTNLMESEAVFDRDPLIALAKRMSPSNTLATHVAFTSTDLTEGRGYQYPIAVCELESTATRLGEKKYVMGTDAPVEQFDAVLIHNKWYGPVVIHKPNEADKARQAAADLRKVAEEKALKLGLTKEELSALRR
jgi:hypothetical protein